MQLGVKTHPQQPRSSWKPGTIASATPTPRSYIVEVDGRKYRRNRVHLRDSLVTQADSSVLKEMQSLSTASLLAQTRFLKQPTLPSLTTKPSYPPAQEETDSKTAPPDPEKSPAVTRYGEVVKPPARLKDFIK